MAALLTEENMSETGLRGAPLVIVGASDQAFVVLDILERLGAVDHVVGVVDALDEGTFRGAQVGRHQVEHTLADVGPDLFPQAIVIPAIGSAAVRASILEHAEAAGLEVGRLIDQACVLSPAAALGKGVVVGPLSFIGPDARVGAGTIVNTGAIIEHHVSIGDFCHVGPGATLTGHVSVGDRVTIGAGACVRDEVTIGNDAVVGLGAAVVADVPSGVTVVGVPARPV